MEALDAVLRQERRLKRAAALRWKQFVTSLTTVTYGVLAVGVAEPLLKGAALRPQSYVAMLFGAGGLAVAVLLAPWTEVDRD